MSRTCNKNKQNHNNENHKKNEEDNKYYLLCIQICNKNGANFFVFLIPGKQVCPAIKTNYEAKIKAAKRKENL